MNLKRSMLLLSVFAVLVFNFQNCGSPTNSVDFSSKSSAPTQSDSGQPYDGKVYVVLGELCPDNTKIQSRIVLKSAENAELNRRDCQDIAPVILSSQQYQIDAMNPDQLIFENKTYTAWSPDQVGAGFGVSPKLTNPVNPINYGAVGDGVTDNTAAFTSALAAGDMLIPAGNYVVTGTVRVPGGRNIQCASTSAVKILSPTRSTSYTHTFQFGSPAGGSISNCSLAGPSTFNPNGSVDFDQTKQFNLLVAIVDYTAAVSNVKVINNIFENCHGNACVSLYGGSGRGVSNSLVSHNTFNNCGYYGIVISAGTNNTAAYNHMTDCGLEVANDKSTDPNFNNIFEYNYLTVKNGNGFTYANGSSTPTGLYLTGGQANQADYSSNLIRYNTVIGNGTDGSIMIKRPTKFPAQYTGNACTNGCQIL